MKKLWLFEREERYLNAEELLKTEIYEDTAWYRESAEDYYYYYLKAARFDLYRNPTGLRSYLGVPEAHPLAQDIDIFRPIHVLLRRYVQKVTTTEQLDDLDEEVELTNTATITERIDAIIDDFFNFYAECLSTCQNVVQADPCSTIC